MSLRLHLQLGDFFLLLDTEPVGPFLHVVSLFYIKVELTECHVLFEVGLLDVDLQRATLVVLVLLAGLFVGDLRIVVTHRRVLLLLFDHLLDLFLVSFVHWLLHL